MALVKFYRDDNGCIADPLFNEIVEQIAALRDLADMSEYMCKLEYWSIMTGLPKQFLQDAVINFRVLGSHAIR